MSARDGTSPARLFASKHAMLQRKRAAPLRAKSHAAFRRSSSHGQFVTKRTATSEHRYGSMRFGWRLESSAESLLLTIATNQKDWSGNMADRLYELVALGPELLAEAKRRGKGVNESHLLVHQVLSRAFKEDLTSIPSGALRAHLASRLTQTIECRTA